MMKVFTFSLVLMTFLSVALTHDGLKQLNCTGECQKADVNARMTIAMKLKQEYFNKCAKEHQCPLHLKDLPYTPCQNGKSDEYPCSNVDLLSFVSLSTLGSNGNGNDIWGWTDPETGKEYAIVACVDGTSFVDVTDPMKPEVLGFLPTHTYTSSWRDVKVYGNHAFIGSEASSHGLQVYDLTKLRKLTAVESGDMRLLNQDAHYGEFGSSHNIVANEDTGYVYSVGSRTCTSGLHVVNVRDPKNPQFAGCFGEDGYVHDAQCVMYNGPDTRYQGREICFCYNENTLTIVDVEDKNNMKMLSRVPYNNAYYTHQGWLMEDQTHLLLDDELDELYGPNPHTRTLLWNVKDLENPVLINSFYSSEQATDHNLYIKGNLAYQSNYCAGLRILSITDTGESRELEEVGYYDVAPYCDTPGFSGTWSNYPYFASGTVIVNSIERGLFVLKYTGNK